MLLFKRIFSLLSGFNCIWTAYWTALMNKQTCSTTGKPTRSFATERVSLDSV